MYVCKRVIVVVGEMRVMAVKWCRFLHGVDDVAH